MNKKLAQAAGPQWPAVRDITLGELLREAAETVPDRIALISGVKDPTQRRSFRAALCRIASPEKVVDGLGAFFEGDLRLAEQAAA